MRRSYVNRSKSSSSSTKSVRGSLKFKARFRTCSGPALTFRYHTHTHKLSVDLIIGTLYTAATKTSITKVEQNLSKLGINPRFWIRFTVISCGKIYPMYLQQYIETRMHFLCILFCPL